MIKQDLRNTIGCPNCSKLFDNKFVKRVTIKNCGHICCQKCYEQFVKNSQNECLYERCYQKISRQSSLENNHLSYSKMKFSHSQSQNQLFCSQHPNEISNLYCFDCEQNMCFECSQQKKHYQHQLMSEQNIEKEGKKIYREIEKKQNKMSYEYKDFFQQYVELMVIPKMSSFKFQLSKNLEKKKFQILEIFEKNRKSIIRQYDILQDQFIKNIHNNLDEDNLQQKYKQIIDIYEDLKQDHEQQNNQINKKLLKNNMGQELSKKIEQITYKFKDYENLYDQKAEEFINNLNLKFNFRKNDSLLVLQNKNIIESQTISKNDSQEKQKISKDVSGFEFIGLSNKSQIQLSPKFSRQRFRLQSDSDEQTNSNNMIKSQVVQSNYFGVNTPMQKSIQNLNELTKNSSVSNLANIRKKNKNLLYASQIQLQKPSIKLNNKLIHNSNKQIERLKVSRRKFDLKPNQSLTRQLKRNHHSLPNLLQRSQKFGQRLRKKKCFEVMTINEAKNAIEQGNQVINLSGNLQQNQLLKFIQVLQEVKELQYLNISNNGIEDRYFQLFCKKLPKMTIKHLDISKNQIFYEGIEKLMEFCVKKLRIKKVTALNLKISESQKKRLLKKFQKIEILIVFDQFVI